MSQTRRQWLTSAPAALSASTALAQTGGRIERPNLVLIISDQFRWDCVGALGLNPMNLTPNLDRMASRGVVFRSAFSNQPVCAPARGSIFTGLYPRQHGVFKNGVALKEDAVTLATVARRAGYSANYIGKWHLGLPAPQAPLGPVAPPNRGGFLDFWLGSNELEHTSHPYEGDLYDGNGQPVHYSGQYRTDFMTGHAQQFLRSAKSPFLLCLSYLEVHHQNDVDKFVPPKEYASRYPNPFVPEDLRPFPGSWPSQLSDYYSCVAKMDETVGTIRTTLRETGLDRNTILMFTSDHGCHFKTRNTEYKRSPHEGSIHIPLLVEGPGFNRRLQICELVSQVDFTPTLLDAAGLSIPPGMQGHSMLPLLDRKTEGWRDEVYFEMSEFITGRGLRTPQYTYAVAEPKQAGWKSTPGADRYVESAFYDNYADPHQLVNLAGRAEHQRIAQDLRARLLARMKEAGDPPAAIENSWFPYP